MHAAATFCKNVSILSSVQESFTLWSEVMTNIFLVERFRNIRASATDSRIIHAPVRVALPQTQYVGRPQYVGLSMSATAVCWARCSCYFSALVTAEILISRF